MNDFTLVKGGNFGDEYYWDYRLWFEYKGQKYTYLGMGSVSGYIRCSEHIGKGFITMLNGHNIDMYGEEWEVPKIKVPEKHIIKLVKELEKSGADSLDVYD